MHAQLHVKELHVVLCDQPGRCRSRLHGWRDWLVSGPLNNVPLLQLMRTANLND